MWMSNVVSAAPPEHERQLDDRLIIKSGGRVVFVPVTEIDWIQAAANYVRLYCTGKQPLLFRKPISQLDAQIAAIVQTVGAKLATRNVTDFEGCGIKVQNPWH